MQYLYLHGFASSPQSRKAQYLRDRFAEVDLHLHLLDLNQDDFTHLTITRQLQQAQAALPGDRTPVTLIGSSLGGLTAAYLAELSPQVQQLVCLAPAFNFLDCWLPQIGDAQMQHWSTSGYLSVYHYGAKRLLPLHYKFVLDAQHYDSISLKKPVSTLILHGQEDEIIPIQTSQDYAASRSWVKFMSLKSNHALTNVLPEIWQEIRHFCQL
ncbi:MAG: YqiA/YcfP family alpha/beta fold hydrolase [Jaaginema sp. PMC 1079.18]|nr:YqiA/YcfP family alpha/beta fold hydrolase [Jaaginema sp. PMC 1080.18]MEC4851625.1 YqiA/YcfP family alpha/beta fold hydrolase [Jaaginema sp. PMC 1079.18]MEC4867549.1 YqiA/YcfP family alpha/beta fold hydrolase [Jaaginema sp. PMC 1078.18]